MNLPTVFDTCEPREDVLNGTIADADFAADLAKVIRRTASDDYKIPARFFANTYPTAGLKNLLRNVLARLTGDSSAAACIFRLDTSYGGGKTHGLIALVHAANGMQGVANVAEFVDPKFVPGTKIRIAAFDGENADPANGRNMDDGILAHTPWGELACSLAGKVGYDRVRKSDESHTAPGAETLAELFGGEPCIILLDELSVYLRKAHNLHGKAAGEQLSAFLTSLFKAVESNPRVSLVYTLAIGKEGKSADAYSAENQFIADKMAEAESISARKATLLNPTEDNETVQVLLRRLFGKIDRTKAAPAIDAYRAFWLAHKEALPPAANHPETIAAFRASYPLHPEVLDTLTTKTATLQNFQRVRGMLRLLARTIGQLWQTRPTDATAIQLHHIDLGFEPIRQEFFTKLGRTEFIPAVNHDIAGGVKQSLAAELDEKFYGGLAPYTMYTARTVFIHSLAFNDQLKGLSPEHLRFSVAGPTLDLSFIDAAWKRFRDESSYLDDRPGVPLRFLAEANLTQVIRREETNVDTAAARAELNDRIKTIFGGTTGSIFETIPFPASPGEVDDDLGNGRPRLALMAYDGLSVGATVDAIPELITRIFERKGSDGVGLRGLRNHLVFVVADETRIEEMRKKMVRRLALLELIKPDRIAELADHQQRKVRELEQKSEMEVATVVQQCYRHVFYPSRQRLAGSPVDLAHAAVDLHSASDRPGSGQQQVVRTLRESTNQKLRLSEDPPESPGYIRDRTPLKKGQISTAALRDEFRKDPALSIHAHDSVLIRAITQGIQQGDYVYRRGELLCGPGDPMASIIIDEQSFVFTMQFAKEKNIWPRPAPVSPSPKPDELKDDPNQPPLPPLEPTTPPPPPPGAITAEGVLKAALTELWEKARKAKFSQVQVLSVRLVANQLLEVQVAVPCDESRKPISAHGIFHEKAGIIEDKTGDRLAFNGSLNETEAGWTQNWESLNIFRSWLGDDPRVAAEETNFAKLWAGESKHVITMPVLDAVRDDLLRFLPVNDLPARLKKPEVAPLPLPPEPPPPPPPPPEPPPAPEPVIDLRRLVWAFIKEAPKMPNGGERVGEATSNVEPWPHQIRAFQRLYGHWPPRLLLADEVGLGKTIQAGMLIRQAWLADKARRVLILSPASICRQWQLELREKFNLNWPIYDGDKLIWLKSPGGNAPLERPVSRADWHKEPFVIASSHLMRRRERVPELAEQAEPWDIVVMDEAHHARRKSPGLGGEPRPNRLLDLLHRIKDRTKALLFLTATPMQVHPVEVWDLLSILGLPPEWNEAAFLKFCTAVDHPSPSHDDLEFLAQMFRATEHRYGATTEQDVKRSGATSGLQAKRILSALRDSAAIPRRQMDAGTRGVALRVMRSQSPIGRLISRHTRDLLRRYHKAGKMQTPIADRDVEDRFVPLSAEEARIYTSVENYISTTYNQASAKEKNAVGFVMTIYRRRLASSFHALRHTLEDRLTAMKSGKPPTRPDAADEADTETTGVEYEMLMPDEVSELELDALAQEEKDDIASLLERIRQLPPDTKAEKLRGELEKLRADGYPQAMVFTQYTDTMDFLREELAGKTSLRVMCFSGRGGEVREKDGRWRLISREDAKRLFRAGKADVLLCTDAAAEGLNFQFCGSLINYDMPWNPMRVEQRIGRIDRLGQQHAKIRIVNLHYEGTVETDVYMALRRRIHLFESVVGRLQPILAKMSSVITGHVLGHHTNDPDARAALTGELERQAEQAKKEGFDLDAMLDSDLDAPPRPAPKFTLPDLDLILQRADSLPPGIVIKKLQNGEYAYQAPGMAEPVRITTRPEYFDEHSDSLELWSPGSPSFPTPEAAALPEEMAGMTLPTLLKVTVTQSTERPCP